MIAGNATIVINDYLCYDVNMETRYTIAEIDEAIEAVVPHYTKAVQGYGWSRPHAMLSAAAVAWVNERPEDRHTAVLRAGIRDMNRTGCLHPHDGVWPE